MLLDSRLKSWLDRVAQTPVSRFVFMHLRLIVAFVTLDEWKEFAKATTFIDLTPGSTFVHKVNMLCSGLMSSVAIADGVYMTLDIPVIEFNLGVPRYLRQKRLGIRFVFTADKGETKHRLETLFQEGIYEQGILARLIWHPEVGIPT